MTDNLESLTREHLASSIQWISEMSGPDRWNLKDEEVATLLGGIDIAIYEDLKCRAANGQPLTLTMDIVQRLSLLLGIWRSLQLIVPVNRQDLAYSWFGIANNSPLLNGKSIKDYLLDMKTIDAMYAVKRYLDSTTV
jgi:hypothetical protein